MQIATWNVNSVRSRLTHVLDWLQANPVDVLCLQETKVTDDQFPQASFSEMGYQAVFAGQKSYNGVALLSRQPLSDVRVGFGSLLPPEQVGDLDEQKRLLGGRCGDVYVLDLYVPNGSAVGSEKYDYKLRWLACLREYLAALLSQEPKVCVCGDFNIALEACDIHDPERLEGSIMASELEREALRQSLRLGFADAFRKFTAEGGHYSWWDYRTGAFRRNAGWRIDHLYLTPSLYDQASACQIDREPRQWEKPSDHAPVLLTLGDP
jgi:exodeoxyribonuclease-3